MRRPKAREIVGMKRGEKEGEKRREREREVGERGFG